ncbi:transposase [Burkholderiales bacterium]|nr:transposase [Burkholderiales bacterium]
MRMPANNEEEIIALHRALDAAHGEIRTLKAERDLYKEKLRARMRELFAAKSEVRVSDQRDFFFNEAEALAPTAQTEPKDEVTVGAHKRAKRGRKPIDPNIPREVVRVELPESERVCPHDGAALQEIGVEASEQYHVIPQQVHVLRTERVKYACPCCDKGLRLAPAPARIIPKGILSDDTLAWVISSKFQDGLPLYRQAALLARFGGEISRNTLAGNVNGAGLAVQPLINLFQDQLFEAGLIHGDETEVQVLKEPGRAAQRKSYMWIRACGSGPPIRLFTYAPTRSAKFALELYAGVPPGAVLLTDGYESYEAVARGYALIHAGCWAHARRGFIKALEALPKAARTPDQPAAKMIDAIRQLYAVDSAAETFGAEQRLQHRKEHSRPVIELIEAMVLAHLHAVNPESLLGKAFHYLHGQWPKLVRFLERGDIPLDNNDCENALRPFVVGRKNWLFSDTVAGAKASANLYSLIETAKACGVEPYQYLRHVFARLPLARTTDDYEALLPWRVNPKSS